MKISINLENNDSLSLHERKKILEQLRMYPGVTEVSFESEESLERKGFSENDSLPLLLSNLVQLQEVALHVEEENTSLTMKNELMVDKVRWLRSISQAKDSENNDETTFRNEKLILGSGNADICTALVRIINKLDSEVSNRNSKYSMLSSKKKRMKRDKLLVFNSEYYNDEYVQTEFQALGLLVEDPLHFFIQFGGELGISPSDKFDTKSYLAMNPDVKNSGMNPLLHYLKHGKAEGRVLI